MTGINTCASPQPITGCGCATPRNGVDTAVGVMGGSVAVGGGSQPTPQYGRCVGYGVNGVGYGVYGGTDCPRPLPAGTNAASSRTRTRAVTNTAARMGFPFANVCFSV